jgi:hypothetical protein
MTFGKVPRIVVLSGLIVLFWFWIDPAFAVVLGIISMHCLALPTFIPSRVGAENFGPIALI